ncbi:hypothetical protein AGR2A_Cc100231 [Agrobacterium genomosp. 2 str. CFBP 5494]|uniref:Uncharacterized protein n=4 Tax=Bacteria TaxID=2 RepID=A0A9W5F263_9HYPH|nr:hypothetical protein RP007_01050 [Rhizobium sp. P007]CUW85697.1 hypothetical protein AGR2A_Cc100231 [Agrobacterium genomosp. 2 str. CFBP 5494]
MNMKVKMLTGKLGSNDGVTTKFYEKDETYEVSEALGNAFIEEKVAEKAGDDATTVEPIVAGQLYTDKDGAVFIGEIPTGKTEAELLPIEKVSDEKRAELIKEGKLKEDGTAVDAKAVPVAPQNKAILGAPKNKAR